MNLKRPIAVFATLAAAGALASPASATYAHRHTCGCGHVSCTTTTSGSSTTTGGTTTTSTTTSSGGTTTTSGSSTGGSTTTGGTTSSGSSGGEVPEPGMFGLLGLGLLGVGLARYRSRTRKDA